MDESSYAVEDRSLLLPLYKRLVIAPLVRFVPESVHPNAITHLAHLASLAALLCVTVDTPSAGSRFLAAALLVQLYCWADNADGAHARRTGRTSKYGEFLDHGLDSLSALYVVLISAALLALSPFWWVVLAALAPGAAGIVYWEQTHTGVMRLGLLNQIEGMLVLALALVASGLFGTSLWSRLQVLGTDVQTLLLAWTIGTMLFGIARGLVRVVPNEPATALSALLPLAALLSIVVAAATGAVGVLAALPAAASVGVYFSTHMLALRFGRAARAALPAFTLAAAVFGILAAAPLVFGAMPSAVGSVAALLAVAGFTGLLVADIVDVRARLLARAS